MRDDTGNVEHDSSINEAADMNMQRMNDSNKTCAQVMLKRYCPSSILCQFYIQEATTGELERRNSCRSILELCMMCKVPDALDKH